MTKRFTLNVIIAVAGFLVMLFWSEPIVVWMTGAR